MKTTYNLYENNSTLYFQKKKLDFIFSFVIEIAYT